MATRVVLDTNVAVSALLWGGTPWRLIQAATEGQLILCTSPALLTELHDVLGRRHLAARLQGQGSSVEEALALYDGLTLTVTPPAVPRVVTADPDDDHVIAAALAAGASLIVSGDHHLLDLGTHQGVRIVTPADALKLVGES